MTKPVDGAGGYGLVIGPTATDEELAVLRAQIEADPRGYISQEVVQLSRVPTWPRTAWPGATSTCGRSSSRRPTASRCVPGGLTRVALRKGSLVVNSSQGGGVQGHLGLGRVGRR